MKTKDDEGRKADERRRIIYILSPIGNAMSEAGDGMFSTRTFDKEETGLRMFGNKQICVYFFF